MPTETGNIKVVVSKEETLKVGGEGLVTGEKLVSGASCLVRQGGMVGFVPGLLPGERARVQITKLHKGYFEASLLELLTRSEKRRSAPCPHYESCGGCDLQHLEEEDQRNFKRDWLIESFQRLGKLTLKDFPRHHGEPWAYRRRMQVHRDLPGNTGFQRRHSHEIVSIVECPVLSAGLNEALAAFRADSTPGPGRYQFFDDGKKVWLGGKSLGFSGDSLGAGAGEKCEVSILEQTLVTDPEGFFQSNPALLEKLLLDFQRQAGQGSLALDLYGGMGLFGSFLKDSFGRLIWVESNPRARSLAKRNYGKGAHEFHVSPVEKWLQRSPRLQPDLVVVDPPRTGLDKLVRKKLKEWQPRRILYVSCNPDTLARDCGDLCQGETYGITELAAYDFYPQTSHLEVMVQLDLQ